MQAESALLIGCPNGSTPTILSCLDEFSLHVESTYSGADGLRLLAPEQYAVAICELPLSDVTPAAFVSGTRRSAPATSVVLLAGPPAGPPIEELIEAGADEIVARPIDRARLVEAIARALHRRRLALEAQGWRNLQTIDVAASGEERAVLGAVEALTRCLEAKDVLSDGHARSVAALAQRLAGYFGLSEEKVEEVRIAGVLHDLGKVGIDQAILAKPVALTGDEWEKVREHPTTGADIVETIDRLGPAATYVRHHHERHDGSGYPAGLEREAIPFASRLIAVADAYDAMVRARPYRKRQGSAHAASEFRRHAGTQWDSEVVDGLFACVPDLQLAVAV